jgi:CheY-like chemotaxis protein
MKILIADDDFGNREPLAEFFEAHGHDVVEAKDGLDALQLYRRTEDFDWVLTDYQMPRKNGVVLLTNIRELNPAQRMLLMSGDPPKLPEEIKDVPVLTKGTFRMKELLEIMEG